MYKTKLGLRLMDKFAKPYPRLLKFLASVGIIVGFLGMGFILYFLSVETIKLIFVVGTQPALAPVLPGVKIAGAPDLSFWHWILAIFIAAGIHELSHGLIARLHNIPIKSSGFAFFGPLLAAFVEPDEKVVEKKSVWQQLGVFAAGPFSNILLGGVILLFLLFVFAPVLGTIYEGNGIIVNEILDGYPMQETGVVVPFTILGVNGEDALDVVSFVNVTEKLLPGEKVILQTDQGEFILTLAENPNNVSKAFFGVSGFEQETSLKEEYNYLNPVKGVLDWFYLLILWIFLISVGVGMFNLLPLGPVDGGRMFYSIVLGITKKEKIAKNSLLIASIFCLVLILINMIPWLEKLFVAIWGVILLFIGLF